MTSWIMDTGIKKTITECAMQIKKNENLERIPIIW